MQCWLFKVCCPALKTLICWALQRSRDDHYLTSPWKDKTSTGDVVVIPVVVAHLHAENSFENDLRLHEHARSDENFRARASFGDYGVQWWRVKFNETNLRVFGAIHKWRAPTSGWNKRGGGRFSVDVLIRLNWGEGGRGRGGEGDVFRS